MTAASKSGVAERRRHPANRETFDGVFSRVEPFLDPETGWTGQPLEHLAYNVLREKYPHMSEDELNKYFMAAKRAFKERNETE
ncbi:conserved protein of unknown function [Sterolibacterium denitrificans]|uniref:Uncharacterized protein n=1 Tax=Sterolibacterium denitrificans TaxID=157592 RepID=A0A7Z7MVE6_9PROT|nr:hypothetical protein [Sterolibacterium denitrificans]SMB27298.1 conserved protein of unknown function [Sterolibacterium denitrificans]